jgi:hypothetical protein
MASDNKQNLNKKQEATNNYLKYSGLAIQMLVTLGLAGWAGYYIDNKMGWSFPFALLSFILLAFIGLMVILYRSLNK